MARTDSSTSRVRMAFIPGILTAVVLLAGLALIDGEWFFAIRLGTAILAAIMAGFAVRGRQYWWLIVLVPIIVVWNPVFPLSLDVTVWRVAHIVGAALVIVAGLFIRVPLDDDDVPPRRGQRR